MRSKWTQRQRGKAKRRRKITRRRAKRAARKRACSCMWDKYAHQGELFDAET